jgi:hypothetical protein
MNVTQLSFPLVILSSLWMVDNELYYLCMHFVLIQHIMLGTYTLAAFTAEQHQGTQNINALDGAIIHCICEIDVGCLKTVIITSHVSC